MTTTPETPTGVPDDRPVPAIIAAAQAAALAAREWSVREGPPAVGGRTADSTPPSPDSNSWCGRPPTPEEVSAAEERARESEVDSEISLYLWNAIRHAWFEASAGDPEHTTRRYPESLSPAARARAHGTVRGLWMAGRNRGWCAYACMDCDWVGELAPRSAETPYEDAVAATLHRCRNSVARAGR